MDLFEASTQSFIIKIWIEETAAEAGRTRWRGHITHVPSGQRRYLEHLEEILPFMEPHLRQIGIRVKRSWPFRQWWQRCKHYFEKYWSPDEYQDSEVKG